MSYLTHPAYQQQLQHLQPQQPLAAHYGSDEDMPLMMTRQQGMTAGERADFAPTPTTIITNLDRVQQHNSKKKSHMVNFVKWVEKSYQDETGKSISLGYLVESLPAKPDTGANIDKYANVFKTLVKEKLTDAPKTSEAVSTGAAKKFWLETEKPHRTRNQPASSPTNPYAALYASPFTLRPFFRKNNVWMYGSLALVLGGVTWWIRNRKK